MTPPLALQLSDADMTAMKPMAVEAAAMTDSLVTVIAIHGGELESPSLRGNCQNPLHMFYRDGDEGS